MSRSFQGRPVLPGETRGCAIVSKLGFNTLAVYLKCIMRNSRRAISGDRNNPDIFGRDLTHKIICMPCSIGSTTAGLAFMNLAKMDVQPKALLFSDRIDSLAAAGIVLSTFWAGKRIIAVDGLGVEFLDHVKHDDLIKISLDGTVIVSDPQ